MHISLDYRRLHNTMHNVTHHSHRNMPCAIAIVRYYAIVLCISLNQYFYLFHMKITIIAFGNEIFICTACGLLCLRQALVLRTVCFYLSWGFRLYSACFTFGFENPHAYANMILGNQKLILCSARQACAYVMLSQQAAQHYLPLRFRCCPPFYLTLPKGRGQKGGVGGRRRSLRLPPQLHSETTFMVKPCLKQGGAT